MAGFPDGKAAGRAGAAPFGPLADGAVGRPAGAAGLSAPRR